MTPQDQALIAQLSGQQLGAPPAAAAPAGAMPPEQPASPPVAPKANPNPTAQEKAVAAAAPTDAGAEEAIDFIELDDDDGSKRQMTKKQIKSTLDRYRDLNYKWQDMKPVADIVQQLLSTAEKSGYKGNSKEVAEFIQASVQAYITNPTMGQQKGQKGGQPPQETGGPPKAPMSAPDEGDEHLSKWEKENAVSLPPGYRESLSSMKGLGSKVDQIMAMLQGAMQSSNMGVQAQQAGQQAVQQGQQATMSAAQQQIKNNLTQAMMQAQIDPSAQQDFMVFAMQRGYTPEDFIDPGLASTVMQDYKANKDAPEINRLREIAARRQAFTGMVEGAPGAGASASAPAGDPMLAGMIGSAMRSRNLG
jgi:hypothetical protein